MAWVRLLDLHKGKSAPEVNRLMTMVIEETALMKALVIIHGETRAAQKYIAMGGHLRFDSDDELVVWDGVPSPTEVVPTTPEIQALADEAEAGYDPGSFTPYVRPNALRNPLERP